MSHTIHVNGLDVWGNAKDGFEINDVLGWHGTIKVESLEHDKIILALLENEIIWPGKYSIDDFGDELFFGHLVARIDGKPILQLKEEGIEK